MEDFDESVSSSVRPVLPTGRLRDVVEILENKQPSVLNLDACLPPGNLDILAYILDNIGPSITTLSLRFNDLKDEGAALLAEWLNTNETVEVLYLTGAKMSPGARQQIENAFTKHLLGHRTTNMGFTLIRVAKKTDPAETKQE
mmetsp:Transcript_3315/g.5180  ORF Transcript_3315/g.5180 Transcript_3315/m.5180 type:complete len:143 (+) Transcript_3315:66-494(+)